MFTALVLLKILGYNSTFVMQAHGDGAIRLAALYMAFQHLCNTYAAEL